MIEVFITDIQFKAQTDQVLEALRENDTDLKIHFDLKETPFLFPCGHTILRIEGKYIMPAAIIATLAYLGLRCEVLEDKICI